MSLTSPGSNIDPGKAPAVFGSLSLRSLREMRSDDLRALLTEEAAHWARELDWDFRDVATAVADAVDSRTIAGCALQDGLRTLAYTYWLPEDGRGVVGSSFATERARDCGLEERALRAVLAEAQASAGCSRVEGQTLFSTTPLADAVYESSGFTSCGRQYLVRDLAAPLASVSEEPALGHLSRSHIAEVAALVYESHLGSADAVLNSVYLSVARTRHFIDTLVLRDGCGRFMPQASLAAFGPDGLHGVVLCSRVSAGNGHICQVSVLPRLQGRGLGRTLMVAALARLRGEGLKSASLSVTMGNERALRLYESLGFRLRRAYGAHAWARPPQRIEL